ncbi:MAG: DoxX family protein [Micropruina sp.]|nr:MAG: DoxX family protein [Micropruina sp.]
MTPLPHHWWLTVILAAVLALDVGLSVRPVPFIRDCLDGVRFPRDWWWTLLVAKCLAISGLVAGLWLPGVGLAANVGVIAYFLSAATAHVRARFTGPSFWLNCLGMLTLSVAVLVASYAF